MDSFFSSNLLKLWNLVVIIELLFFIPTVCVWGEFIFIINKIKNYVKHRYQVFLYVMFKYGYFLIKINTAKV